MSEAAYINSLAALVAEFVCKDKSPEELALVLHFLNLLVYDIRSYLL